MLFLENVFTLFAIYNPMWFHSFIVNWSLDTEQWKYYCSSRICSEYISLLAFQMFQIRVELNTFVPSSLYYPDLLFGSIVNTSLHVPLAVTVLTLTCNR